MSSILVVDDSAICREPMAAALESIGHEAVCAASGEEALTQLNNHGIDLVLLDLSMPGLDGFAVLRSIRRNPLWSHIPVIVVSGASSRDAVIQAAQIGIQGYLLKSRFCLTEFLERVEGCLGVRESDSGILPGIRVEQLESFSADDASGRPRELVTAASGRPTAEGNMGKPRSMTRPGPGSPHDSGCAIPTSSAASLDERKPLMAKDRITRILRNGLELKPLSAIVNNVMAATANARCSVDDVARVVTQDQALSLRLLKLANSSAYSRGRPVDSVKDGIRRIGIQEVRSLVTALAVAEQYQSAPGNRLDSRLFWEHSIACGLAATAISRRRRSADVDEFMLWGLLHDVGRMILLEHVPDEYAAVCETAEELDVPLEAVEAKLLHFDHAEVLEQALRHWQFPSEFIVPVANHHRSMANIRRLGEVDGAHAATLALADRVVHALLLGSSINDVLYPLDPLIEYLGMEHRMVEEIAGDVVSETDDLKYAMLARSHEDTWPDAKAPLNSLLQAPIRPLVAGAADQVNPCRLLVARLAGDYADETCNVGIIWAADAKASELAFVQYERMEGEAGCGPLPILVVCGKGRVDEDWAALRDRARAQLICPVSIKTLVRTIAELLDQ